MEVNLRAVVLDILTEIEKEGELNSGNSTS